MRLSHILAADLMPASPAAAQDKLTVLLEWFVNSDHDPVVAALELGLFEKAGLEVTASAARSFDRATCRRLRTGGDRGHYQPNLYLDHEVGLLLVPIGTLVETPLKTLTVLADGPIDDLTDLAGKRIGFPCRASRPLQRRLVRPMYIAT